MTLPGNGDVRQGVPAALVLVERGSKIWPPYTGDPVHGLVPIWLTGKNRREITSPFRGGGKRTGHHRTARPLQLLPGEEEKGLVLAVIEMRDDDRAAEREAVVVLDVLRSGEVRARRSRCSCVAPKTVELRVGVEIGVAQDVVRRSVKAVRSGCGRETADAARGAAELSRRSSGLNSKLLQRVHRRRSLVEGRIVVRSGAASRPESRRPRSSARRWFSECRCRWSYWQCQARPRPATGT